MTKLRILLVDDHEIVRAGLRALVEGSAEMSVVGEATTGEEAISKARELTPDIVIMDISMPGLDGVAATERIAHDCPDVRVIALTAHDDRAHVSRLLQAGATGYVLKRGVVAELVRAIRVVAEGGTYVDPILAGAMLRGSVKPTFKDLREGTMPLSDREEEVLRRIAWGASNKEIASQLGISTKTVETYKARITEKLGLKSRTEMVRYALQKGWLAET